MHKNSSKEFELKKEFIDLQIELKKYIEETGIFTLNDILKDPLVIHSIDDYINAYKEQYDIKQINKTLKKLLRLKKKNLDLTDAIKNIKPIFTNVEYIKRQEYTNSFDFTGSLFTLKSPKQIAIGSTNADSNTNSYKENLLNIFKNSFKKIEAIKRVNIKKPVINRNFSVSSSHSQLLKKIDKTHEIQTKTAMKAGNEITATASFRNGVLKNTQIADKGFKTQASNPSSPTQASDTKKLKVAETNTTDLKNLDSKPEDKDSAK